MSTRQLRILRQLFLHYSCLLFIHGDDLSSQWILEHRSRLLLLRTTEQMGSETLLLLPVSPMALQRNSGENRLSKFLVWVYVAFLGFATARLLHLRCPRGHEGGEIDQRYSPGKVENRSRLR